jgi:hypothetical protein
MRGVRFVAGLLVLCAGLAGACKGGSTDPVISADDEFSDYAVGIGADQAGVPGLMLGSSGAPAIAGCVFDPGTGRIECPDVIRAGLTFSRSIQLLDANGGPLAARGPDVASVNTRIAVLGTTVGRHGGQTTVDRHSDLTVTGLGPQSTQHTHNGSEQGTMTTVRTHQELGAVTIAESFSHTAVNVVIPRLHARLHGRNFPLSGTASRSAQLTRTVISTGAVMTHSHSEVITFNGTALVPAVVTRDGVTRSCERNLLNGRLHCG